MKYLVIGAGGTGGIIAAALSGAGYDVTLIARGKHLQAIKENGLTVHRLWDDSEKVFPVTALSSEEYEEALTASGRPENCPDVIFVCVKGYSIPEIIPFLRKVASSETVIIPVLNIYTTGEMLRGALKDIYILDGCIYVSSNIEGSGRILQHSPILRIIFGEPENPEQPETPEESGTPKESGVSEPPGTPENRPVLHRLEKELNDAGIRGIHSGSIRRDALKKFCYVSPVGAAGLYYNANAGTFKKDGPERELFIGMMKEIEQLAAAMGCAFDTDVIAANLNILDHQPPEATTSMQRDVMSGGPSEIQGLVYDITEIGKRYGVEMPLYRMVAQGLKERFG